MTLVPPLDADLWTSLEMTLYLAVIKLFLLSTEERTSCEERFPDDEAAPFCFAVPTLAAVVVFEAVVALPGSPLTEAPGATLWTT